MRTRITTKYISGRNLAITTFLMVSLLAINNSAASNSFRAEAEKTERFQVSNATDKQINQSTATCLMAKQLKDRDIKEDYDAIIADRKRTGFNGTVLLDPISIECLGCHDGTLAKMANHRISDGDTQRAKSIETILGAHPIGMDYDKFSRSKAYVSSETLAADIILINGQVGCVSCHNLLKKSYKYLAIDNSRSGLCFSCHNV